MEKLSRMGVESGQEKEEQVGPVEQVVVTDSGVCSDSSEGSSSPQYRSWRSVPAQPSQRWSSPGEELLQSQSESLRPF